MKKFLLPLLCLLLGPVCARADMVITETMDGGAGQAQTLTVKIKGDKVRTDVGEQMSTIMDTVSGDTITLIHAQKSYMKLSSAKTKALMEQMKKMQGQTTPDVPAAKPKFVDTGKSEKVNNYNAEIYTAEMPTMKLTFWVTKEFPNYAAVTAAMKKLQNSVLSKLGPDANGAPDTSDLPGLPIKTQIVNDGQTITITIVSAKDQPVDDADMGPPAGYTEMALPEMPKN